MCQDPGKQRSSLLSLNNSNLKSKVHRLSPFCACIFVSGPKDQSSFIAEFCMFRQHIVASSIELCFQHSLHSIYLGSKYFLLCLLIFRDCSVNSVFGIYTVI